jgi:hypothetical protein
MSPDERIRGILIAQRGVKSLKAAVKARQNAWAASGEEVSIASEEPQGADGKRLRVTFEVILRKETLRSVHTFQQRDDDVFELLVACEEANAKELGEQVTGISDSLELGVFEADELPPDGSPAAGPVEPMKPPVRAVPNPWLKFAPGSSVTLRIVTVMGENRQEMRVTHELVGADAESYTVRTSLTIDGEAMEPQENVVRMSELAQAEPADAQRTDEMLETAKGKLACVKATYRQDGADFATWTCDAVPGGVVRATWKGPAGTSETELIDYQAR